MDIPGEGDSGRGAAGPSVVTSHSKLSSSRATMERKLNMIRDVAMEFVVRTILHQAKRVFLISTGSAAMIETVERTVKILQER